MLKNKPYDAVTIEKINNIVTTPTTNYKGNEVVVFDSISNKDTHNCYNPKNNSFTAPIEGLYSVSSVSYGTREVRTDQQIIYRRAGDTIEIYWKPKLKKYDWVIKKEDDVECLLEIVEIFSDAFKGECKDSNVLSKIGKSDVFDLSSIKLVPKNITLDTYKLLYEK